LSQADFSGIPENGLFAGFLEDVGMSAFGRSGHFYVTCNGLLCGVLANFFRVGYD